MTKIGKQLQLFICSFWFYYLFSFFFFFKSMKYEVMVD